MLQSMKERMTGPAAWIIVAILVVPFAFFGIEQFRTGGGDPAIAEVNGEDITQSEFQQAYQQQYQRLAQMLGESFRPEMVNNAQFRMQVLDDVIQQRVLRDYAQSQGYGTADADLMAQLRKTRAFQEDGVFSPEAYRAMLARVGQRPEQYEAYLRNVLAIEQLRDGVLDSSFFSAPEFDLGYRLDRQTRALRYVRFPVSRYEDEIEVTDEQVAQRYETRAVSYRTPERIKLAYIELDRNELPPAETPGEDVLRLIYDAEKANRFSQPEERLVRHILVNFGSDRDASRERVEQLRRRIAEGAAFDEVARESSDDPSSKDEGGSLGWVRRGQFGDALEETMFALDEGQLSEPVESAFGWHLLRVDEIRPARTQPFEDQDVQAELLELYSNREAAERFDDFAERIEDQAFQNAESLQAAAEVAGLEIKTTDWLTRADSRGLLAHEQVREQAFSEAVLAGENSSVISVSPSRIMVLRKQAYEPARRRELDEVAAQIRAELRVEAARARAAEAARDALEAVRGGSSLDEVIESHGLSVEAPGMVARDDGALDEPILRTLFKMPRPQGERPSFEIVVLPQGDSVLLALDSVTEPSPEGATEAERASVRERLTAAAAGAEFTAVLESIRQAASVEIEQAPQEALTPP